MLLQTAQWWQCHQILNTQKTPNIMSSLTSCGSFTVFWSQQTLFRKAILCRECVICRAKLSYQYRKSCCGDIKVRRFPQWVFYTGKTTSLYWIRPQVLVIPDLNAYIKLKLKIQHVKGWFNFLSPHILHMEIACINLFPIWPPTSILDCPLMVQWTGRQSIILGTCHDTGFKWDTQSVCMTYITLHCKVILISNEIYIYIKNIHSIAKIEI